ncbi:hypothetical protein KEJ39_01590 [Candidatus Bathyarchaeota archaeon]|nr:hypothetical protein [Candidatus Bathyarchaeota archaeon]
MNHAVAKYGYPREILTGRGSQFEAYLAERGIKHILARVNHPRQMGSWRGSTASTSRRNTSSET